MSVPTIDRRRFLQGGLAGAALLSAAADRPAEKKKTTFQVACMTLTYARFPLARALQGIKAAGYRYVAWGTTHQEADGKRIPVLAGDASEQVLHWLQDVNAYEELCGRLTALKARVAEPGACDRAVTAITEMIEGRRRQAA